MYKKFCRYFSSLWFDNDGTINNLTIDDQNNHELHALRMAVSDSINDIDVINITEQGFDECRKIYLDSVLRMTRAAKDASKPNVVVWDTTSKMAGVAPGRQLAADALFKMLHKGLTTSTGTALFATAVDLLGSIIGDVVPGMKTLDASKNMISPASSMIKGKATTYIENKFPDGKISSKKFEGMNDLTVLMRNKDWE